LRPRTILPCTLHVNLDYHKSECGEIQFGSFQPMVESEVVPASITWHWTHGTH